MNRLAIAAAVIMAMAGLLAFPLDGFCGQKGRLYVIGLGPAGPATATLQALQTIKRMDALVSRPRHLKPFAAYIGDTPVWFDHISGLWDYKGKFFTQLAQAELEAFKKERARITQRRLKRINDFLAQGKNLGMLESGNPCVFSSSHWYLERMDPRDVVIVPGMGSASAAMAALGHSAIPAYDSRFLLQSAPFVITDERLPHGQVFKDLAKYQPTMVFYMALKKPKPLFDLLGQALPRQTPCAVVFWAGHPDKQRVLRGTIGDMPSKLAGEKERYMGILFVGRFLQGKPYLAAEH